MSRYLGLGPALRASSVGKGPFIKDVRAKGGGVGPKADIVRDVA